MMSDHGTQFVSLPREVCPDPDLNEVQRWLEQEDIIHIKARIKHPQSNGKVEKAGGTLRKLTAYFGSLRKAFHYYNFERPHWSLDIDRCETPSKAYIRKMWPAKRYNFVRSHLNLVAKYAPEYLEYGIKGVK
jgi:putative transposase